MHPVLARLGPVTISSYGLLLGLSFILGLWLGLRRAERMGLDRRLLADAAFWIVLGAVLGARLYDLLLHGSRLRGIRLETWFSFQSPLFRGGGMVMFGGIAGGLLAGLSFFRLRRIPFLPYADAFAPGLAFGIFLTRLGCFLNGCCFGLPTAAWYGVRFPGGCPASSYQAAVDAHKLWPSQLLLSVGGLAIGMVILARGERKPPPGSTFFLTVVLAAILSFVVDWTRYYPPAERWGLLSHSQVAGLVLLAVLGAVAAVRAAGRRGAGIAD
jgi:phosphatidylglycerol:prolipoprotein diacylglycerol transferase